MFSSFQMKFFETFDVNSTLEKRYYLLLKGLKLISYSLSFCVMKDCFINWVSWYSQKLFYKSVHNKLQIVSSTIRYLFLINLVFVMELLLSRFWTNRKKIKLLFIIFASLKLSSNLWNNWENLRATFCILVWISERKVLTLGFF